MINKILVLATGSLIAISIFGVMVLNHVNTSKNWQGGPNHKSLKIRRVETDLVRSSPNDLSGECVLSDVVVIGRFTKLLRVSPTPVDSHAEDDFWLDNHTVYSFEAERYLKGDGGNDLKIRYQGGEVEGVLYIDELAVHPRIGGRYLLFLKSHANEKFTKKNGYITVMSNGRYGKGGDADELTLTYPFYDQIMLKSGVTQCVSDENHPKLKTKMYSSGEQIIGVTEDQAIASVNKALAQEEFDKNRFIGK